MPLRAGKYPVDQREWDQWTRAVPVKPDVNSVGTDRLTDKAVTDSKLRDSEGTSVLGRSAGNGGAPADIVASVDDTVLVRRAGVLAFGALTEAEIPATIARESDITDAIAAHVAASDPHPQYLTQGEGDARYQLISTIVPMLHSGTGSPETVVTAPVGHLYLRTDGGAGTSLYVKESGAAATGWIGK